MRFGSISKNDILYATYHLQTQLIECTFNRITDFFMLFKTSLKRGSCYLLQACMETIDHLDRRRSKIRWPFCFVCVHDYWNSFVYGKTLIRQASQRCIIEVDIVKKVITYLEANYAKRRNS